MTTLETINPVNKRMIGKMLMNIVCSQLKPKLKLKINNNFKKQLTISYSIIIKLNFLSLIPKK